MIDFCDPMVTTIVGFGYILPGQIANHTFTFTTGQVVAANI